MGDRLKAAFDVSLLASAFDGGFEVGIAAGTDSQLPEEHKLEILGVTDRTSVLAHALNSAADIVTNMGYTNEVMINRARLAVLFMFQYGLIAKSKGKWDSDVRSVPKDSRQLTDDQEQAIIEEAFHLYKMSKDAMQAVGTIVIATKICMYQTNHHVGQGSMNDYLKKVYKAKFNIPDNECNDHMTFLHAIGHWASTVAVFKVLGLETGMAIEPAVAPFNPNSITVSEDMKLRISGVPAGLGKPNVVHATFAEFASDNVLNVLAGRGDIITICSFITNLKNRQKAFIIAHADYPYGPNNELMLPNYTDRCYWTYEAYDVIRQGNVEYKDHCNPMLRYHQGASYFTGEARADPPAVEAVGLVGSYLFHCHRNATITRSPAITLGAQARYTNADSYNQNYDNYCEAMATKTKTLDKKVQKYMAKAASFSIPTQGDLDALSSVIGVDIPRHQGGEDDESSGSGSDYGGDDGFPPPPPPGEDFNPDYPYRPGPPSDQPSKSRSSRPRQKDPKVPRGGPKGGAGSGTQVIVRERMSFGAIGKVSKRDGKLIQAEGSTITSTGPVLPGILQSSGILSELSTLEKGKTLEEPDIPLIEVGGHKLSLINKTQLAHLIKNDETNLENLLKYKTDVAPALLSYACQRPDAKLLNRCRSLPPTITKTSDISGYGVM